MPPTTTPQLPVPLARAIGLPIGAWLVLGYALVIAAFAAASVVSLRSTRTATADLAKMQQQFEPLSRSVRDLGDGMAAFDRALLAYLRADSPGKRAAVVPPGSVWTRDPFGANIEGPYMYGRGTMDMKGALAAMVHAASSVDRSKLAGTVIVSASVMEEVFEGGALKTVMDEAKLDFVVIGEATQLNLVRGGRGRAEIHIETIGKPSHSSSPQLGVSAIHLMTKVIAEVEKIPLGQHDFFGPAIFGLTDIISEPYPGYSVIPSRCKATYDRRLLPGEWLRLLDPNGQAVAVKVAWISPLTSRFLLVNRRGLRVLVVTLIESGQLTNAYKNIDRGKSVWTFAFPVDVKWYYDTVHRNQQMAVYDIGYTNTSRT